MPGTLQLTISRPPSSKTLRLDFPKVLVTAFDGGMRLHDTETGRKAVLWDVELRAVSHVGGGPTFLTAFMVRQLLEQKFVGPS